MIHGRCCERGRYLQLTPRKSRWINSTVKRKDVYFWSETDRRIFTRLSEFKSWFKLTRTGLKLEAKHIVRLQLRRLSLPKTTTSPLTNENLKEAWSQKKHQYVRSLKLNIFWFRLLVRPNTQVEDVTLGSGKLSSTKLKYPLTFHEADHWQITWENNWLCSQRYHRSAH